MARGLRGEYQVELGGESFTLRLALGDLEALEGKLGVGVVELARRFTTGQARIGDAIAILTQGFRGAGLKKSDAQIKALIEKTGVAALSVAAGLLLSVFADDEGNAGAAGEESGQTA